MSETGVMPQGNAISDGTYRDDIFDKAQSILAGSGAQPSKSSEQVLNTPQATSSTDDVVILEREDIQALVEFPFDLSALITRYDGFELDAIEAERLSKLFLKPMQRLLGKTKNVDLVIALASLGAVISEKAVEFNLYKRQQRKEREVLSMRKKQAEEQAKLQAEAEASA